MLTDRLQLCLTAVTANTDCDWANGPVATCAARADLTLELDPQHLAFTTRDKARQPGHFNFCIDHAHGVLRRLLDQAAAHDMPPDVAVPARVP